MHKIYFDRHCVIICSPGEKLPESTLPSVEEDDADLAGMAERMKSSGEDAAVICVRSRDNESAYLKLCRQFREVNAAGGLVTDGKGNCLMIFRNGLWDLPKGHQETGEDIRETAVREVAEETGVMNLEEGELIGITDHCYIRDGLWHLKHSWWYEMRQKGESVPVPQTEEGISEATWVSRDRLGSCLENTYPSIRDVFREYEKKHFNMKLPGLLIRR